MTGAVRQPVTWSMALDSCMSRIRSTTFTLALFLPLYDGLGLECPSGEANQPPLPAEQMHFLAASLMST